MMWRKLLALNLALVAVIAAGAFRVRQSWNAFDAGHRVESVQPEPESVQVFGGTVVVAAAAEDWSEISIKNPFSFDRTDISIVAPSLAATAQPKPVLFGTMSIGNERIAMLAPAQSNARTSRPVKVGESIDTWQVVEIQEKSVVVTAANGSRQTIIMNDPTAQPLRTFERTGAAGSGPSVSVINTTPAGPPASTASSSSPTAPAAQPPASTGQATGEMLMTPFGPVPRTRP